MKNRFIFVGAMCLLFFAVISSGVYAGEAGSGILNGATQPVFDLEFGKDFFAKKEKINLGSYKDQAAVSRSGDLKITNKDGKKYVEGEVIVKFKENKLRVGNLAGAVQIQNLAFAKDLVFKKNIKAENLSVFKAEKGQTTLSLMADLEKDPSVEYAQPNYIYQLSSIDSNDTYKDLLWGMDNSGQSIKGSAGAADADIDAPEAWAISQGSSSAIVAIIDTGVAYNHPDLSANMWDGTNCKDEEGLPLGGCVHGYDFEDGDKDPQPTSSSHGTHIAGTIAAVKNNSKGVAGIAPNTKIMAIKTSLTTENIALSIAFAEQNGARVINASWGGTGEDAALEEAVAGFSGLFVTSAGNGGDDQIGDDHDSGGDIHIPCDYNLPNIVCVAALNQNDVLTSFSDYGTTSVDVAAPGYNIYSTIANPIEDFENVTPPAVPASWTVSAGSNWGTVSSGTTRGKVLYGDLNRSPYSDNASTSISSPSYDLAGSDRVLLDFYTKCDTEYKPEIWTDYMALDFSNDGGNTFYFDTRWDEWLIDHVTGDSDPSGSASAYFQVSIPSEYLASNFKYRFRWVTNGTDNNHDGCFVDDVSVGKYSDGSDELYGYMSGTSMAAPHVTGLAGLILGFEPVLTTPQLKSVILQTGDTLASLSGKILTEKRINAYNALNFFNPIVGYSVDNVLPASQISQSTSSIGRVSVNFKIKDGFSGLASTLSDFGYSVDNGSIWKSPTNGDSSAAFSANWKNNSYSSALDYSGSAYNFYFNSASGDLADLNGAQQDNVKIRFKANDGARTGGYATSETFSVDNLAPDAPMVSQPATTTYINADTYSVTGTAEENSIVSIYKGEVLAGSQTLSATTTYSIAVDLEQNAANDFTVKTVDRFGNESSAAAVPSVVEDGNNIAVTLASVGGDVSSPYFTSDTTPDIVVNGEAGMSCRWAGTDISYSAMPSENECTISGSQATCSLPDQGSDGAKNIFVSCKDRAGNENSTDDNLAVNFDLDTAGPTVVSALVSPAPAIVGTVTTTITFSDTGVGLNYSIDPVVTISGLHRSYTIAKTSFSANVYTGTFQLLNDDEDVSAAVINVSGSKDLLGNEMAADNSNTFSVDTTVPVAELSGLPTAATTDAAADITVGGAGAVNYKYKLDGGSWGSSAAVAEHIILSDLGLGFHTIKVVASDSVGNWQSTASSTDHTWAVTSDEVSLAGSSGGNVINVTGQDHNVSISSGVSTTTTFYLQDQNDNLLDFAPLTTTSSTSTWATIPAPIIIQATSSVGVLNVRIPSGAVISGSNSWLGLLNPPTVKSNSSVTIPPSSGITTETNSVVEVGFDDVKLSFDKGVRLLLSGQAGKSAGYYRSGVFTRISSVCGADSQVVGDALAADGDCKIDSGLDMVIWTKHFTKFVSYTSTAIQQPSGGGGGGGAAADTAAPAISNILVAANATSSTVTWNTNESSLTWITYGTSTAYGKEIKTSSYSTSHSASLNDLAASTVYHYQIKSQDYSANVGLSGDKIFTTLAEGQAATTSAATAAAATTGTTKSFSQMTRTELINFILQLIISLRSGGQQGSVPATGTGSAGTAAAGQTGTGTASSGLAAIPAGFTFKNNLEFGMISIDVRYLQIVLNSDPDTRVASAGAGSPGKETNVFGNATKAAVNKFQQKYAAQILTPYGRTQPTGAAGPSTRAKLNSLLGR
ncbi:MAG: S8 family serine peptidase [Candidatus Paceibacterota bacterium]|jgi:subtilisin family serine protease